jgi:hypothetical protein
MGPILTWSAIPFRRDLYCAIFKLNFPLFLAGYVGCIKDLNINGANIDLVSYAHQQDSGIEYSPGFEIIILHNGMPIYCAKYPSMSRFTVYLL